MDMIFTVPHISLNCEMDVLVTVKTSVWTVRWMCWSQYKHQSELWDGCYGHSTSINLSCEMDVIFTVPHISLWDGCDFYSATHQSELWDGCDGHSTTHQSELWDGCYGRSISISLSCEMDVIVTLPHISLSSFIAQTDHLPRSCLQLKLLIVFFIAS